MSSPDWITIVSGLPRSGTSMMMRMIEAGGIPALTDHVRVADEDNPRGYYEFEPVKRTREDPSWLRQARGRVVKMVHLLLPDLPPAGAGNEYRVVLMLRSLPEVIESQAKMLARSGKKPAPAEVLARVYTAQLEATRAWAAGGRGVKLLEVSYNQMLASPEAEAARVAEFLGLGAGVAAMVASVEPSLYRNRGR